MACCVPVVVVCPKGGIFMYYRQVDNEHDALRARFTVWLEKLIKNARIDYLRQAKKEPELLSIYEIFESEQLIGEHDVIIPDERNTFDFQEEKLAKAFYKLPLMKRRILELLFIECVKPEEIASQLKCSPQYVYNQRYNALKQLKNQLSKGGDHK